MSDIFEEAQDALREEKIHAVWKEYGPTIIGVCAAIILGTAFVTGFQAWNKNHLESKTAQIIQALESEDAIKDLQPIIEQSSAGHQTIALLAAANTAIADENYEKAYAIYQSGLGTKGIDTNFQDLMRVMSVRTSLFLEENKDTTQNLVNMLQPVLDNNKSPWVWHARIEAATIMAHFEKDYEGALTHLKPFDNAKNIPQSILQRAQALKHVYALRAADNTQKPQTTK